MFDNVGRTLDEEAGKRTAASVLLTGLLAVATLGLSVVVAARTAGELLATEPLDDGPITEILIADGPEDEAPPAAPAPPPPLQKGTPEAVAAPEPEPDPEPAPLSPEVPDAVADVGPVAGDPDGPDDGDPNGDKDGRRGGNKDGVPGGTGTGGPITIHHTEIQAARRFQPDYPRALRALGLSSVRCYVRFTVDETGVPAQVRIEDCPPAFHPVSEQAARRWRFEPYRVGDEARAASFTVVFHFRME